MRRLFLLRHAKSSWDEPALADHDRPLAPRGMRATALLAEHLGAARAKPELVLCSSAARTRATLDGIRGALGDHVTIEIEPQLYGASGAVLLERVRAIDESYESAMLIGHNPGIAALVVVVAGSGQRLGELRGKYPTGALATLEFGGRWSELGEGTAELAEFVTPRELGRR